MSKVIAGIDYSLTSPAICVHTGDEWDVNNCRFYYLVQKKKNIVNNKLFSGSLYEEFETDTQRYDNLSRWSADIIDKSNVEKCYIEGYAFSAVGRVFQIAENTGLLKYYLWKNKMKFDIFPPTVVKKFATTKGNANKEKMGEAFIEETGIDIRKELDITTKVNPASDIIDAYYIAKLGFMDGENK